MPVVPRQWDAGAVRPGWTYRSSTLLPGTITNLKITVMTKNYYRSEYSDKRWKALIDKATELGCQITYSKYGNIVTIDSTDRESSIIAQTGRGGQDRVVLAERIHGMIQESTDFRTCSPRDTAKAIVRLFARVRSRLSMNRSVSRELTSQECRKTR